ncbi:MAG: hypothetical protein J6Q65_05215, partial [Lentisphaeria bacterium]|nr:hypothetical protein [Lentisphaeria bacterium]
QVQVPIVAGTGKVVHRTPMLSLDKAYSLEEVINWAKKFARSPQEALVVQPKYDGISALWSEGILATRGDGETGENISDKVELIELETTGQTVPLKNYAAFIRGEIVIRDDDFKNLYAAIRNKNGRTYKNSRNAVAGIMGLKDIREMLLQHAKLSLIDYRLYSWKTRLDTLTDDWQYILDQAEALPYPMDGLVIKIADESYSGSLGNTAHHPRGQIAFKFSGVRRESKLIHVEWSFGKNCLTPVAEIEPVEIGGTTIRHASLHNLQNILDKDLCVGDTVVVERAGDVIPYIVSATPGEERTSCLIDHCPGCGAELVRDLPELRCVNPDCMETKLKNLAAAVKNIGIERLGEPNIRKMMLSLGVKCLADIFKLTKAQILSMEGFQNLSADNLLREIRNAKTVPDWQLLASLNIKGIGPNMAKVILRSYTLAELQMMTVEELSRIDGIGPERANALFRELREQKEILTELLECVTVTETKSGSSAALPTVCFTGKMPEKRSYYENLAREHGYEPADSVNSGLSVLVCMDVNENSGKLQKARKNGIRIVALDDWLAEIRNTPAPVPEEKTGTPDETEEPAEPSDDLPLFSVDEKKQADDEPEQLMLGF